MADNIELINKYGVSEYRQLTDLYSYCKKNAKIILANGIKNRAKLNISGDQLNFYNELFLTTDFEIGRVKAIMFNNFNPELAISQATIIYSKIVPSNLNPDYKELNIVEVQVDKMKKQEIEDFIERMYYYESEFNQLNYGENNRSSNEYLNYLTDIWDTLE